MWKLYEIQISLSIKFLLEHSHGQFCMYCLWQSWEVTTKTLWQTKPIIYYLVLYRKHLLTPTLEGKRGYLMASTEWRLCLPFFNCPHTQQCAWHTRASAHLPSWPRLQKWWKPLCCVLWGWICTEQTANEEWATLSVSAPVAQQLCPRGSGELSRRPASEDGGEITPAFSEPSPLYDEPTPSSCPKTMPVVP